MRTLPTLTLGFVLLALLGGPTADQGAKRTLPAPAQVASEPDWWVEVVATNRDVPWSLAFAPDGRLFFTERPCQVRVMHPASGRFQLQPEPVIRPSACMDVEDGLRGLALDPDFPSNHFLYVLYTYRGENRKYLSRLSRFTEENGRAGDERTILENIPDNAMHNSGRLKFGPDGKLYLATGDTLDWSLPQDLSSLAGKILRLNPDGTIPEDNPYPGSLVYSLGHRNPQGLAWHPTTGQLFITEHGPSATIPAEPFSCCHDELNLILPGANYGWPLAVGALGDQRFTLPILESGTATWAPSGAEFYRSPVFPEWDGNLFFAALRGEHLHRVALKGPDLQQVEQHERLFERQYGRLREVAQGPDGSLYFTTSNRDGRMGAQAGPEDDRILRIVFPTPAQRERRQLVGEVYLGALGRAPDPPGLWFWFYSGLSRPELAAALQDSSEGQRVASVRNLYIELLRRDPLGSDNAGLRSWVETPLTISEIRRAIMESAEYSDVSMDIEGFQSSRNGGWFSGDLSTLPKALLKPEAYFHIKSSAIKNRKNGQISPTLLSGYFFIQWNISSAALRQYAPTVRALFPRPARLSFVDYPNNRILGWNLKSTSISADILGIIKLGNELNIPMFLPINYSDYIPGPPGTGIESLVRTDNIANTLAFLSTLKQRGLHLAGVVFGQNIADESGFGKNKPTIYNSDLIGRFIDYSRAIKSSFPELKVYAFDSHFAAPRGAEAVSVYWESLKRVRQAEVEEGKALLDGFTFMESYVYMDEKGDVLPSQLILDDTESLYRDSPVYRNDVWGNRHPNPLRAYLPQIVARTSEIFGRSLDLGNTEYLPAGALQISETDTSRYSDMDFILHFSDHLGIYAELGLDIISSIMFGDSVQMHEAYFDRKGNLGINYPVHEQLAQRFAGEVLEVGRSLDYESLKVKVYATRQANKYFIMILNKDVSQGHTIQIVLPENRALVFRLPRRSYTSLVIEDTTLSVSGIGN